MHMSPEEVRKEWAAEDPEPFVQPDSIAEVQVVRRMHAAAQQVSAHRLPLQVYNVQAASRTGTPIPLRVYEPKGEGPFPIILCTPPLEPAALPAVPAHPAHLCRLPRRRLHWGRQRRPRLHRSQLLPVLPGRQVSELHLLQAHEAADAPLHTQSWWP